MTDTDYDSRDDTSTQDDIDEFVPDDATPLFGDGDPTEPLRSPIFVTEDYAYNTGVHCRRCFCGVARTERATGVVTCPNCGWSSDETEQSWEDRAAELQEKGGVPKRQAEAVALLEEGCTHQEVTDELGLEKRSEVSTHVRRYRDNRGEVEWLASFGPDI